MEKVTLKASPRQEKVCKVRRQGFIPGVLYGRQVKPVSLQVPYNVFKKLYEQSGESTIIDLDLAGEKRNVLIKEVQLDPLKSLLNHVDFYVVEMSKEITAEVELKFVGVSKAVKDLSGVLVKNMDKIEVTCLPAVLPKVVEVDISALNTFEDSLTVENLVLAPGVRVKPEAKEIVATVTPPRSEEELAKLEETVEENVEKVEGVKKEEPEAAKEGDTEVEAQAAPEKKDKKEPEKK